MIMYISLLQSIISLINSIFMINNKEYIGLMIVSQIFFKLVDFMLLGFFSKFHNDDLITSTNGVTLARLIWNIIESLLKSFNVQNKKILFEIQLFGSILSILYFIYIKVKEKCSNELDFRVLIDLDEQNENNN